METSEEVEEVKYGCDHYKRRCKFYTQCCGKFYTCRFCHDENETHSLSRDIVKQIQCTECLEVQPVQRECSGCARVFGKYFCAECRLFDDEDKGQYHCVGCGICRIGGREKFFHCPRCNMCLPRVLENKHQCVENMSRANCPICMEDIHTSRIPSHIPSCGHLIHRVCFDALVRGGHYACPVCQKSMLKMETIWKHMDEEIAATPMPPEYSNYYIGILCKDCHKECSVLFHPIGSRCEHCGSYNTCRSTNPELSTEPPLVTRPRTTGFGDVIRASFGNPARQQQSIEVSHEPGPVEENDPSEELD